ncbi:MAG: suppressor of fused domain protein [Deltaproteobacteria bacterium]|nr:suppressor of fused domain protein [Deltaproteobacteria bacterium]
MKEIDPFDAIENRLLEVHPGSEFLLFGGVSARSPHALNGAVVMRVESPRPHWLIVSQGFTELWDKTWPDPNTSGMGFELACRVPARGEAGPDCGWVLHWMQGVADVLAHEGTALGDGHWMSMTEPQTEDEVCALAFVRDPELGEIHSRNGGSHFLEMIGLRAGELDIVRSSSVDAYVECLRAHTAVAWIDPTAPSPLRDPLLAQAVNGMLRTQPSATGVVSGPPFGWRFDNSVLVLELDEDSVLELRRALTERLAHGQPMVYRRANGEVLALLPEAGPATREVRDGQTGGVLRLGERLPALLTALDERQSDVVGLNVQIHWVGRPSTA